MADATNGRSAWRRLIDALKRPPTWSLWSIGLIGIVLGVILWGGFNTGMEATNTLSFCTGCHEMYDNVYQEYQSTVHWENRTGVRAICSDCHVPKDWGHKLVRKAQASMELYGKLTGYVNTKEKFEAHRMAMAEKEWARMKSADSRECRNCHSFTAMDVAKQRPKARDRHKLAQEQGKTCIDCHKGIAHLLPKEYQEEE